MAARTGGCAAIAESAQAVCMGTRDLVAGCATSAIKASASCERIGLPHGGLAASFPCIGEPALLCSRAPLRRQRGFEPRSLSSAVFSCRERVVEVNAPTPDGGILLNLPHGPR